MKRWIGRWLVAVAVLHTGVALALFGNTYRTMWSDGLWGAGVRDAGHSAAAWFLLFGILALAAGLAVSAVERSGARLPRSLGVALLGLAVLGIVLMPVSGFWLVLPPALALLRPARDGTDRAARSAG